MLAIAVVLLVIMGVPPGSRQIAAAPSEWGKLPLDYRQLADQYQQGGDEEAVKRLVAMEGRLSGRIESVLRKIPISTSAGDCAHFRVAAMLHLDAAELLLANGRADIARSELSIARQWADLCDSPGDTARSFRRRWYVVAALMVIEQGLAAGNVEGARNYLNEACGHLRDDALLLTIAGWLNEQVAIAPVPLARGAAVNKRAVVDKLIFLDAASAFLKRALDADPAAVEPALRRGRVLTLRGNRDEARGILSALVERRDLVATDAYLARLLLARVEEQSSDHARAAVLYEQAKAILPSAQSAALGAAFLQSAKGDSLAAGEAIATLLSATEPATTADPWFDYVSLHLRTADAIRKAMRAEVQR